MYGFAAVNGLVAEEDIDVNPMGAVECPGVHLRGRSSRNGGRLTFSQERLWVSQQSLPHTVAYHFQTILHWTGELDVSALRISLGASLARHKMPHSRVLVEDGQPRFLDLSGEPITRREQLARVAVDQFVRQASDLGKPPLMRWMLIRLDPAKHWLVHSQTHLVHNQDENDSVEHSCVERT